MSKRCVAALTGAVEEPTWKWLILAARQARYSAMDEPEGQAPSDGDKTSGRMAFCSASARHQAGALCKRMARDGVISARVQNVRWRSWLPPRRCCCGVPRRSRDGGMAARSYFSRGIRGHAQRRARCTVPVLPRQDFASPWGAGRRVRALLLSVVAPHEQMKRAVGARVVIKTEVFSELLFW